MWTYYTSTSTAPASPDPAPAGRPARDSRPARGPTSRPGRVVAKRKVRAILMISLFFAAGLVIVVQSSLLAARGYELYRVERQIAVLQGTNERLELEVAALQAPERIARVAQEKLGMVKPEGRQVVYLNRGPDRSPSAAASAAGAQVAAVPEQSLFSFLAAAVERWLGEVPAARAAAGVEK